MTQTHKQLVLNHISAVYDRSRKCKLNTKIFEILDAELSFLSEYFHTSKAQTLFLSIVFSLNCKRLNVDIENLNSHFDCNPMKLLEYNIEFEELYARKILLKKTNQQKNKYIQSHFFSNEIYINDLIIDKILKSEPIPEDLNTPFAKEDIFELLENLYELSNNRVENNISTRELFIQVQTMFEENAKFPLIEKTKEIGFSLEDKYLFFYLVWRFIEGDRNTWIQATFKDIYDRPNRRLFQIQEFISKENDLIKDNWIELEETTFLDDSKMKLTEKSLDLLFECGIKLFNNNANKKKKNIIQPDEIPSRQLIYCFSEAQQVDLLKTLLIEENLKKTQERLIQKALPKGITVLLHGVPGTGKTETVLQIAKESKREITKVDICNLRSMWFGESEKMIKQIFKDYREYAKIQLLTPILFFNEADAVFSKRKLVASSNISDTENRIQNILLEEIENFEGILMATTNLTYNLDKAFERRFLFKIEFQKPSVEIKTQIWKQKMPHLSDENCTFLAKHYDFTGGQIDNIVRKNAIHEILYNNTVEINMLIKWCDEEMLNNESSKSLIGF